MKNFISFLLILILSLNTINVFSYSIDEGAKKINDVIVELSLSNYTFEINKGSSAEASYYVFYKGKKIGYIYSTEDGITLGEGWDADGELGIFFNQQELSVNQIVARFYDDKTPLKDGLSSEEIELINNESFAVGGDDNFSTIDFSNILPGLDIDDSINNNTNLVSDGFENLNNYSFNEGSEFNNIKIENSVVRNKDGISYSEGLEIINSTKEKLAEIDTRLIDETLQSKMLFYRKIWNNTKDELEKESTGLDELKKEYVHKKVEEKYKEIFKEFVLQKRITTTNEVVITDNSNNINKSITKEIEENSVILSDNLSSDIVSNFKIMFYLANKKYNSIGSLDDSTKENIEELFDKIDNENRYFSVNDFLGKKDSILNDDYNIVLLQKLMIIMCK